MSVIERIDIFRKSQKVTQKEFCAKIAYRESSFSNALKRNSDIGSDLLFKIASAYSQLNIEWLVTGKGSMLRDGPDDSQELKECIKKKELLADLLVEKELEIKKLKSIYTNVPNKSKLNK